DPSERRWLDELVESRQVEQLATGQKTRIFELLTRSEVFDHFMAKRFPQVKRYGLEGAESMMVVLDQLFRVANLSGIRDVILGMPHRGRLNLLTDLLKYPPRALFHKVKGNSEFPPDVPGCGDVLSHIATKTALRYAGAAADVKVSLLHNPSHLEAVNPVAAGKARARQMHLYEEKVTGDTLGDCQIGDQVLCVQLHGDSAFTGQGVVTETLGLSNLPHFTCGGSIHVIVNNQIGYTTPAMNARSTVYTSDIGKMINAPVIHVNADYPEDVVCATEIAFEYRHRFRKDVIIDLIAYRRMGHNELDEPSFTQPMMYKHIRGRKTVPVLYEDKLLGEGLLGKDQIESLRSEHFKTLDGELEASYTFKPEADTLQEKWSSMIIPRSVVSTLDTGVDLDTLREVGRKSVESFGIKLHPRLEKYHVANRLQRIAGGAGLDWATCEALAFGTLLMEGFHVRISGQDVGRGTFSQRHAMLVDQDSERTVIPLNHMCAGDGGSGSGAEQHTRRQGKLEIANSSLSEFAVLGFETGVSWDSPGRLCMWEAQFGDFFNGAQVIIDTYLASGESKWLRQSGLVLLLPHGYDGAGPEHSSCRIERFLQLCDTPFSESEKEPVAPNMHVVNPTTPAQYYHLLRRQMKRDFRKPLVVAAPKLLLRHPAAVSALSAMAPGTSFRPVLADATPAAGASRVVFLSGKLYYEVAKARDDRVAAAAAEGASGVEAAAAERARRVSFVRLEEIAPFPWAELREVLRGFPDAKEFIWLQEEPQNQGCYSFVAPRLEQLLPSGAKLEYRGRRTLAAPATGISQRHKAEQAAVVAAAFD
ncbi:hypothetical protein HK405_006803, partial [Cladochytrium tenue]